MPAKSSDTKSDGAKPEVTYVYGYNDPEADMVLKTKDGKLFRVHSHHLKAHSAYFRCLATPADLGTQTACTTAIDIDGEESILQGLLGQVLSVTPPKIVRWTYAKSILQLGSQYQFDTLPRLISLSLDPCLKGNQSEVFILASQQDLEPLAKAAVCSFGASAYWQRVWIQDTTLACRLKGAAMEYVVALFRAMRLGEKDDMYIDWEKAGHIFSVSR